MDAQTSGGLLLAVPAENEAALLAALKEEHTPAAAVIGRLMAGTPGQLRGAATARRLARPQHSDSSDLACHQSAGPPQRMDQLENAARRGLRVALSRRGTEYIVVAMRVTSVGQHEAFIGRLPMTGEELTFRLDDIDSFQVIE